MLFRSGAKVLVPAISGALTRKEIKEQGKSLQQAVAGRGGLITQPAQQLTKEKPVGVEGEAPILPETTTISSGKRRYKRRTAKKTPSVRQSVRVNVIANPKSTGMKIINKKYINNTP